MYLTDEWIAFEKAQGGFGSFPSTYQGIREAFKAMCEVVEKGYPPPDPSLEVYDEKVSDNVAVRVYRPKDVAPGTVLPLGVFSHGGGNVSGSPAHATEDYTCRYISLHTPCVIVSVDFRLAPEHPPPAQRDDICAAYAWAREKSTSLGSHPSRLFMIGNSAGGGLALSATLKLIEEGKRDWVCGLVIMAAVTLHPDFVPDKFKERFVSYDENETAPIYNKKTMYALFTQNFGNELKSDPSYFPALSPLLPSLPPTYISTCGADPLRDDGTVIADALKEAGVRHKLEDFPGWPHFFWIYPELSEGDVFRRKTVDGVRFVLADKLN